MAPLRVLIAEDEYIPATLLEMLVRDEGHHVCGIVAQGHAVVEAVRGLHPDVVLMDVYLADGVSGVLATRDLVQLVNVPVIIISGTDDPATLEEIGRSGALGYLRKPVTAEELRVNLRIAAYHNKTLASLRASEVLHRSLFDNAAVGIYVCHRDGYYQACNQAFAHMLGYSGPSEVLRGVVSIDEQVYAEPGRRSAFLPLLEQGRALTEQESRIYSRSGDQIWVAEHLTPNIDEDGVMISYEGVVINISDRKKIEDDRRLAQSLLRNTIDAMDAFVAVTDLEGNLIITNRTFEQELGELVGLRRVLEFAAGDNSLFSLFLEEVRQNPEMDFEFRGQCVLKGSSELLNTNISRYSAPDGGVGGAVFVMRPAGA